MPIDWLTIALGFLEGFALIISPCILPILPIVLAGALTGSKKRPYGIICGFIIVFVLVVLLFRNIAHYFVIDTNLIRHASYLILLILGIIMLSNYLTEKFNYLTHQLVPLNISSGDNKQSSGFFSGFLLGGLIAIIWTPCAGPFLAAIIVQTVMQKTTLLTIVMLIAFTIGVAVPMLFIALFGREIIAKFNYFRTHAELIRKILGGLLLLSVGYMIYLEYGTAFFISSKSNNAPVTRLKDNLLTPYPAPEITGIHTWINSPPLQLNRLRGKVVLIDFWTYSCINCIRTLPYLNDWYQKYHDKGLVIIGIHSPEFDFEKNVDNVKAAVEHYAIHYPIALDNQFATWNSFGNRYWPAHYLINIEGKVIYSHFGEGDYDILENNIQFLLGITNTNPMPRAMMTLTSFLTTPETYLGYRRAKNFFSPETMIYDKPADYTFPEELPSNSWALQGNWIIYPNKIVANSPNATLKIKFHAEKVFMVMGSSTQKKIHVQLLLNGATVIDNKGSDVSHSSIDVLQYKLYEVIAQRQPSSGILQIIAATPGLEVYTFTFGE